MEGQATEQPLPQSMNPHEAQAIIAGLLAQEETKQEQDAKRNEKGQFKPAVEQKTEEATPTEEPSKVEGETTEAKVEEEPQIQPEVRRFKLKYKGEELEKEEPEVIELAQKGWDYTQKSQALAKERDEIQVKIKTEQDAARNAYAQQLEVQRQAVLRLADQEALTGDLARIALEDPSKALQLQLKRQQIVETYQSIVNEQQKLAHQQYTEMQQKIQKQAQDSKERLQEKIPSWSDDLYRKVLKTGIDYGFSNEEVSAVTDHRIIEVLNDARQWREYQSAKPKTVDKRVTSVPKVQKPGTGDSPSAKPDKVKEGMAQLSKTGKREDAQALVLQMIEAGRL